MSTRRDVLIPRCIKYTWVDTMRLPAPQHKLDCNFETCIWHELTPCWGVGHYLTTLLFCGSQHPVECNSTSSCALPAILGHHSHHETPRRAFPNSNFDKWTTVPPLSTIQFNNTHLLWHFLNSTLHRFGILSLTKDCPHHLLHSSIHISTTICFKTGQPTCVYCWIALSVSDFPSDITFSRANGSRGTSFKSLVRPRYRSAARSLPVMLQTAWDWWPG